MRLRMPKFRRPHLGLEPAPFIGILVMLLVLAAFNVQLIFARAIAAFAPEPAVAAAQHPAPTVEPTDKRPRIVIPGIAVDAPVVYDMTSVDNEDVQKALEDGVVHFGTSPNPGEPGNAIFVGHSSNQPWAPGHYKFVFATLDRLNSGDQIFLYHDGIRYTYEVVSKKVVSAKDVSVLERTSEPTATFITCTPLGTNLKRLVVHTKLIDPTPKAVDISQQSAPELNSTLPGDSYTAWKAANRRINH